MDGLRRGNRRGESRGQLSQPVQPDRPEPGVRGSGKKTEGEERGDQGGVEGR